MEKRYSVNLRSDIGDGYLDTPLGIFYGESKFDIKCHIESLYGKETSTEFYLIEQV